MKQWTMLPDGAKVDSRRLEVSKAAPVGTSFDFKLEAQEVRLRVWPKEKGKSH